MKRVSDKADIETIRYWVQSAIYGAEQDGVDITVDVVKDYVGYDEQDPETQAWLDVIIDDEIENFDEPQAKDYWREAEDKYLMGRRSDSKQSKNNNMKRIKDESEVVDRFYIYEGDSIAGEDFEYEDDAIDFAKELVDRGTDEEVIVERRTYTTYEDGGMDDADTEVIWSSYEDYISDSHINHPITSKEVYDSIKSRVSARKKITDALQKFFQKDLKNLQAYRRVTDSEGKVKENVVFLIEDSDVLAVFPNTYGTASRDRDTMVCYSHNGQHGVCTYDYANTLKTADSYDALKDELTNYVGYNLTIVDSLPSETELKQNAREIRDSYKQHKRHAITDERMLARGEEIEYKGKRGTVQYALFHGQEPVVIRWQNEEGSEEFEVPYNEVGKLKIHDSDDDSDNDIDTNVEPVDNDSDIDDAEVTDNCGGKKKTKKKTADNVKRVKITKRQSKKTE